LKHVGRQPPVWDLALQQANRIDRRKIAFTFDDHHGPLTPFEILTGNDGDVAHQGMHADYGLDFRRVYPLATGFDQVLGPAADSDEPFVVDRRQVARVEIALAVERLFRRAQVASDNAMALHLQVALNAA